LAVICFFIGISHCFWKSNLQFYQFRHINPSWFNPCWFFINLLIKCNISLFVSDWLCIHLFLFGKIHNKSFLLIIPKSVEFGIILMFSKIGFCSSQFLQENIIKIIRLDSIICWFLWYLIASGILSIWRSNSYFKFYLRAWNILISWNISLSLNGWLMNHIDLKAKSMIKRFWDRLKFVQSLKY
jgi:hypothetical protein